MTRLLGKISQVTDRDLVPQIERSTIDTYLFLYVELVNVVSQVALSFVDSSISNRDKSCSEKRHLLQLKCPIFGHHLISENSGFSSWKPFKQQNRQIQPQKRHSNAREIYQLSKLRHLFLQLVNVVTCFTFVILILLPLAIFIELINLPWHFLLSFQQKFYYHL